jgi:hypothetical protein
MSVATASYSHYAVTASYALNAGGGGSGDGDLTSDQTASMYVYSASFASIAEYALNAGGSGAGFPFEGYAELTGSLDISGSLIITGSTFIQNTGSGKWWIKCT